MCQLFLTEIVDYSIVIVLIFCSMLDIYIYKTLGDLIPRNISIYLYMYVYIYV